jgi:outer membrane biosynthesis protein TonB
MILLLLFIFFFGLTYLNPPPNSGPEINFGFDETGGGNTASSEQVEQPVEEQSQPTPPQTSEPTPVVDDQVVTQDVVDAAAVSQEETKPKVKETPEKVEEPVKEEPKPDTKKLDNLFSKTKNQQDASKNDGNKSGEGTTTGGGDQGKVTGDRNSDSREGFGGPGDGRLGDGRNILAKPRPDYPCDAEGRVVVKVYVDRTGKVVRAIPGESIPNGKASTTADDCLYREAKKAALKTKWQDDANAKEQSYGYIIYNFSKH